MPRYSVDYEESELDNAIKLMTDSSQVLQIDPYRQQKQDIFFSKSEIDFQDKWTFVQLDSEGDPFIEYQVGSPWNEAINTDLDNRNEALVYSSIYFRAGSKYRIYSLGPYNILDLLGDMGGLLDIVFILGAVITFFFVKDAFESSLLSETYQV